MNVRAQIFILISFFLAVLLVPGRSTAASLQMLVIEYPPLACVESGKLSGVVPEVVRAIQARLNDTSPMIPTPWLRGYEQAQKRPMQAIFPIVRIPEREKLFKWVGPVFGEGDYFFKRKGSPLVIQTIEGAKNVGRIAVRKGAYTHQALEAAGFDNLDVGPSYCSSYRKLMEGRVDLVLLGEKTYPFMVKRHDLDPDLFERTNVKFADSTAWIAFSLDVPDATIEAWQDVLGTLWDKGTVQEIMERNFKN